MKANMDGTDVKLETVGYRYIVSRLEPRMFEKIPVEGVTRLGEFVMSTLRSTLEQIGNGTFRLAMTGGRELRNLSGSIACPPALIYGDNEEIRIDCSKSGEVYLAELNENEIRFTPRSFDFT
jgi:hypothetical protein